MFITARSFAREIAIEMAGLDMSNGYDEAESSFKVNLGGYTVTTITAKAGGIEVWHELDPANWDNQNHVRHIENAARQFDRALNLVSRRIFGILDKTNQTRPSFALGGR